MSGLSRTPGKRVGVNSPPRVRIPLPPPGYCRPNVRTAAAPRRQVRLSLPVVIRPLEFTLLPAARTSESLMAEYTIAPAVKVVSLRAA